MNILGVSDSLVLFQQDESAVIVDKDTNLVIESGNADVLFSSRAWEASATEISQGTLDLAQGALSNLDIKVIVASGRMYTIPRGVQAEAKKGLEWRKEFNRGGTPVGVNSARTLAAGGQIGIEKVRHIAKYFPRHEIDKKAAGYQPGEKGFPSRGRIAWALWGGDAGWRWAQAIVERENAKAMTADGYALPSYSDIFEDYKTNTDYSSDLDAFKQAIEGDALTAPEFIVRVRLDGSGMDRLYKVDLDGQVYVWDNDGWDSLGHASGDIWTYDKSLDDPYDRVEKTHIVIDVDSAIIISARLQEDPFTPIFVHDIDADEAMLASRAMEELELETIDYAVTAAGAESDAPVTPEGDGRYTSEERSKNSSRQVRDATGKFAAQGSRVVVGGDTQNGVGFIRAVNPSNSTVKVEFDDGTTKDVPANTTEKADRYISAIARETVDIPPLDTTGILGQPRTPIDRPNVQMPGTLPALKPADFNEIVNNFPGFVQSQRAQFKPINQGTTPAAAPAGPGGVPLSPQAKKDRPETPFYDESKITDSSSDAMKKLMKTTGTSMTLDAYDHPLLKSFLNKTVKTKSGDILKPNQIWYQPITSLRSAGTPEESAEPTLEEKTKKLYEEAKLDKSAPVELTPDTSDVQPLFLAIVSPDDARAVMDLVSLVPASSKSSSPAAYKRKDGKWLRDESILNDMNSATPPPIVPLDTDTLRSVLEQIDGAAPVAASVYTAENIDHILTVLWGPSLTAAGGADRNRGNAENLRRYWTVGKGGMKIRWGTGGDWTRCVRNLSKYLGPRSKGYCALRHKEMNGVWPGDKSNRQKIGRKASASVFSNEVIMSLEGAIEKAALNAKAQDARERIAMTASIEGAQGCAFTIPLVIPEGIESGDGRKFDKGAIDMRELPLPLMWQIKTADGHMGSVVVGRIDHMERTDQGIGNARGVFDAGAYGKEAERLVREGFIRGVSADMDKFEAQEQKEEAGVEQEDDGKVGNSKMNITHARVMGVTIVPKPAFQECRILLNEETEKQEDIVIPDGVYAEDMDPLDAAALVACGFVAGAIPMVPPSDWFENPQLKKATPLTVTDDGRVFGHIAAWHVDHIGLSFGTKPPRSKSKYSYFHTGVVRTDNGKDVPVGQLTLAGGHAPLEASAHEAARHYDDTASAVSDVHAGEDAYGIWVAGALRPSATPEQIRALRASAPSGDWRPIKGSLELVAVCQVNVPGFPIARARVASGQVMALVAAGASTLAKLKSDPVTELANRIAKLEQLEEAQLSAKANDVRARFAPILEARRDELTQRMNELSSRVFETSDFEDGFGYISRETRQKLAQKGHALPDGSYPITTIDSLKDSIQAYGRGKPSKRAAIRRHIMKRARVLDRADLIPEKWKAMSSDELEFSINDLRSRIPALTASMEAGMNECGMCKEFGCICPGCDGQQCGCMQACNCPRCHKQVDFYDEYAVEESDDLGKAVAVEPIAPEARYVSGKTQPRDTQGKFRKVLARLKQDLGDSGLTEVQDKVAATEKLNNVGDYMEAAKSATELIDVIGRLDSGALDSKSLINVRTSAALLGEVIANLPLPFGKDAEKIRFSDLPPALKNLVKDMIKRVEDKIGKKDGDVATEKLRNYMAGGDYFNQSEVSSEMSKLLRLLT